MPQMSPMNWLILFISFSLVFVIFNMMNYFSYNTKPILSEKSAKIYTQSLNWKW